MASALASDVRRSTVTANYDPVVDVLHLVRGRAVPAEGDGAPHGVELTYSVQDGTPCGAAVIGFRRYGWPERMDLAGVLAAHFGSTLLELLPVIRSALAPHRQFG